MVIGRWMRSSMLAGTSEDLTCVRENPEQVGKEFWNRLRIAWEIQDHCLFSDARSQTGQDRHGSVLETSLVEEVHQPWRAPLQDGSSRLRGHVSRRKSCPAESQDEVWWWILSGVGPFLQDGLDLLGFIRDDLHIPTSEIPAPFPEARKIFREECIQ